MSCVANRLCARCGLEILEGGERLAEESEEEARVKQVNRIDAELRLSCQLEVTGDVVVRARYW